MPSADAADLLLGTRTGRFEQGGEGERRADDRLQQMEPLGPPRLIAVEPAGDLGTLLAIHRDQGVAVRSRRFLYMEQRLAVEHREEHGEEPRRLQVPEDGDGRIADRQILPKPKDGDRPRSAGDGLDLPGTGELRLGGGQDVVLLAQAGQVGGGEGVVEGWGGDTGNIVGAAHEVASSAWSGVGSSCELGPAPLDWVGRTLLPRWERVAEVGR